jgi:hypothetical protein
MKRRKGGKVKYPLRKDTRGQKRNGLILAEF